ncbi:hypothetical protein EDD15DRAFT_2200761 [Pisolithus albus]|nr:hypothetical protein EDD15DRAFT_2200761 [Pisolithus albus]
MNPREGGPSSKGSEATSKGSKGFRSELKEGKQVPSNSKLPRGSRRLLKGCSKGFEGDSEGFEGDLKSLKGEFCLSIELEGLGGARKGMGYLHTHNPTLTSSRVWTSLAYKKITATLPETRRREPEPEGLGSIFLLYQTLSRRYLDLFVTFRARFLSFSLLPDSTRQTPVPLGRTDPLLSLGETSGKTPGLPSLNPSAFALDKCSGIMGLSTITGSGTGSGEWSSVLWSSVVTKITAYTHLYVL